MNLRCVDHIYIKEISSKDVWSGKCLCVMVCVQNEKNQVHTYFHKKVNVRRVLVGSVSHANFDLRFEI
jgi:hypothetical protein